MAIATQPTDANVSEFLAAVPDERRRRDGIQVNELMQRVTGVAPVMWGPSIVGFGSRHYRGRSSEGEWPIVAFSPRKAALTLYGVYDDNAPAEPLFDDLGPHTTSKGCLYIKRLNAVDLDVLERLVRAALGAPGRASMTRGLPLVFSGVTKRFGSVEAVTDLDFSVEPGRVTGFLGPNGAGKTTTLRMLLGLVAPTAGRATIGGSDYVRLDDPIGTVGATLEAAFHPGRSGRGHLDVVARAAGIPRERVAVVLEQVGMAPYADRRVGGYSLGMKQRLGLATALLGDPGVLVLDEPINGLDPEGIRWIRSFLRQLAAEGRTILVSSHLLSEVQQTVDDVVVIAGGRLRFAGSLAGLGAGMTTTTIVDAPDRPALSAALSAAGLAPVAAADGLAMSGVSATEVGRIALEAGVALSSLGTRSVGLEDEFLALVADPERSSEGGQA